MELEGTSSLEGIICKAPGPRRLENKSPKRGVTSACGAGPACAHLIHAQGQHVQQAVGAAVGCRAGQAQQLEVTGVGKLCREGACCSKTKVAASTLID
jgi:hypothetical protein